MKALTGRQLKQTVLALLRADPLDPALKTLCQYPARRVVNPLIGFFLHPEPQVRWRAVTAMGVVVAALARQEMESARVVMRRLMWSLNDESGGIGWGAPEAMGDIMAQSRALAEEYAPLLVSYLDPRGNFLEHEGLQQGVLWGIARLAHARPLLARPAAAFLPPFFVSPNPVLRGTSIWAAGPIATPGMKPLLKARREDPATIVLYRGRQLTTTTVGELAVDTLAGMPESADVAPAS